ncbi:MAG: ABC transporter permease [Rhodobacteraceae bacterium]|nr:ABC transporter permease [Paracoccaceae bacterium]
MFYVERNKRTVWATLLEMSEVTYHATVRAARGRESNALFGLLMNILMSAFFIIAMYVTMSIMGFKNPAIRGDFVVFIMSGVIPYMAYTRTMRAVYGAEWPTSAMMLHGPMSPAISIISSAISALYLQVLTSFAILFVYHVAFKPIELNDPWHAFALLLLSWVFGIATGMVLMAIRPWAPKLAPILMMVVSRVNIFASGKMMVGNSLSFSKLRIFDWNPLFHIIDQARGAFFINYSPRNSEISYAIWVTLALMVLGLMGEFYTRQYSSASWFKR